MTNRIKIYLDTSVINFLFADDAPEKKEVTIDLFDNFIRPEYYETFISEIVIAEILDTRNEEKREKLLNVIEDYPIELLEYNEIQEKEIRELANHYISEGIIPAKKEPDALHVAVSMVFRMDYLVSWNYKHLANINREHRIRLINLEYFYTHDLRIITPLELIDHES